MKQLQEKLRGYINTAIFYTISFIIIGSILLIFPEESLDVIRWIIAIFLIVSGLGAIINDFRRQTILSMFSGSIFGVFLLVMGIITIVHPNILSIIPIILGVWMIISSFFSLRLSLGLCKTGDNIYWGSVISSIISIICGFILVAHPLFGAVALTSILGIILIVYAAAGLADLLIFRRNMKDLAKYLKRNIKVIDGKEVK